MSSSFEAAQKLNRRLELYFSDKRNFLIVFKDKRERQGVVNKLTYKSDQTGAVAKSVIGNFVLDQVARAIDRSEQQLEAMTRRWQHREISNVSLGILGFSERGSLLQFAYLMLLNQHANRTPNGKADTRPVYRQADDRRHAVSSIPLGACRLLVSETRLGQGVNLSGLDAPDGCANTGEEGGGGGEIYRDPRCGRAAVVGVANSAFDALQLTIATTERTTARQ